MWKWLCVPALGVIQLYSCLLFSSVHGSSEAAADAPETPARLYLPAPCPPAQGAPVHVPTGAVSSPALDPQVNRGCYHFSSHGRDSFHWTSPWSHSSVICYCHIGDTCVFSLWFSFFQLWPNNFDLISCNLRFLCLWSSTLDFSGKLSRVQIPTLVSAGQGTSMSCHELVSKMSMALELSFWVTMINMKYIAQCLTYSRHQCTLVIFKILYNRINLNNKV